MKRMLTAVASCFLLTSSCSGRDVDLGNGGNPVNGQTTGTAATTGGTTGSTTGPAEGTTGTVSTGTTGFTTGAPGTTGVTTGGSGGASGTTGGGSGGSTGGGSAGSSGITRPANAIVIRYGDIPESNPASGTSGSSTVASGGNPIDPDTPYLIIATDAPSCRVPRSSFECGNWRVTIGIPRALFQPGILRLNDPRIIAVHGVSGPDRGGGDCWGGGGSFMDGTLEIVDIGATVNVRLADTFKLDFNADGAYAATNCQ